MRLFSIFIITTLLFCFQHKFVYAKAIDNLKDFDKLSNSYQQGSDKLKRMVSNIENKAHAADKQLADVEVVYKDLSKIKKTFKTLDLTFKAAAAIPQIKAPAKTVETVVKQFKESFDEGEKEFEKIAPVAQNIIKLNMKLKKLLKKWQSEIQTTNSGAKEMQNISNKIINCLTDYDTQNTMVDCYDRIINPPVEDATSVYTALNSANMKEIKILEMMEDEYNKLIPQLDIISALRIEINKLLNDLDDFIISIKKLGDFYNGKIDFSFKISFPKPMGPEWIRVNFSVKDILEGIGELQLRIEKIISGFLMKAAMKIGLRGALEKFIKQAKKELQKLVDSIKFFDKLELPSLGKINFSSFELSFKNLNDFFDKLHIDANYVIDFDINSKFPSFNINKCEEVRNNCK